MSKGQTEETPQKTAFKWSYVAFPLAALLVSLIIAAVFYGRLPQDTAYRFSGGIIVSQVSRSAFLLWMLALQLVFTIIAVAVTFLVTSAARRMRLPENQVIGTVIKLMGNMLALPMIIVIYAMVGIFIYNIYGKTLPALWGFALVVLVAGGIFMTFLFGRAFVQARRLDSPGGKPDVRD